MKVILTHYVLKHEFKPLRRQFEIKDILIGAEKVSKNLAIEIKASDKLTGCRFFKVRIGSSVKGRMIVFVITENQKIVPALIRLKKDKIFGMNLAASNSAVVDALNKNLDHILEDILEKRYEELSL